MRRAPLALLLGSLVTAPTIAAAQQTVVPSMGPPLIAHVQSSGRGEVRVTPDHAIVTAVIDTRGDTAVSAAAENTRRYDALVQGLRSAGVTAQQVSSPGYTVTSGPISAIGFAPANEVIIPMGTSGPARPPTRAPSTVVRRTIRVEPVRIADVDRVVQAALTAGATQVGVQLAAPSLESAQRAAYTAAVTDARSNADAMARAAGATLGRLVDLNTSYSPLGGVISYATSSFEGATFPGASLVTVRDVTVVAMVTTRWELAPPPAGSNAAR